jgi:hypothetical protein
MNTWIGYCSQTSGAEMSHSHDPIKNKKFKSPVIRQYSQARNSAALELSEGKPRSHGRNRDAESVACLPDLSLVGSVQWVKCRCL